MSFTKIIINIPDVYQRTNTTYVIPDWLQQEPRVLINRCHDLGPATKLLGVYDSLTDDDIVCVVDDDIIYRSDMLENLMAALQRYPQAIISTRLDEQGSPTGYSGYIFQRKTLSLSEDDLSLLLNHCYCVDDTWLGRIAREKNISVLALTKDWRASMNQPLTDEHPEWYELGKHTNRQQDIQKCLCAKHPEKTERV